MKRAHRMLAAGIGVAALAVGTALLAGPAAAGPSSSPSPSSTARAGSPSASPGQPSTTPSTKPSTSDGTAAGTKEAAPKALVYDMAVSAGDVTFDSTGPGHGQTSTLVIGVRNQGTVTQQGLTVNVVPPPDAHLVRLVPSQSSGIDNCFAGSTGIASAFVCQVHDGGPGHSEVAAFDVTADLPLPSDPAQSNGSVTLHGFHAPNTHPDTTSVRYLVQAIPGGGTSQQIDLVATASPVTMTRGTDGHYHGTVRTTVTNRGGNAVPPVTVQILPPENVTVVGPTDDGFPYHCLRTGNRVDAPQAGLRCAVNALQPGQTFTASWALTADKPATKGTLGEMSGYIMNGKTIYFDPRHDNDTTFAVTFAPLSASPSVNGQAAGAGSSLPVTGTPLALIAGGGAAVLAAGGALLALSRRRKAQSPSL